jgi:hypothetical protein
LREEFMGVILVDMADVDHDFNTNWWHWRTAIEIIRDMGILDEEILERISYNGCGDEITAEQARSIGKKIQDEILPKMSENDRLLLNLTITDEPDDGKMHYDDVEKNYSATREWLKNFVEFCLSSNGFIVS